MRNSKQRQKIFEENCGDDENFITPLAIIISYMVVTLFNAIFIEATSKPIPLIFLVLLWLAITTSIFSLYYKEKNKKE